MPPKCPRAFLNRLRRSWCSFATRNSRTHPTECGRTSMADRLWKLYIYDKDSDIDRDQAAGRFDDDMRLLTYGVEGGYAGLIDTMDEILKGGFAFDRALFQTHG